MLNHILGEKLIDDIGEYLGFEMWSKRDQSKEYDFPGAREENCLVGDNFIEGKIIQYNNMLLLVYKNTGCFHGFKSIYTLNLATLRPTKNSKIQKELSQELIEQIKIKKEQANITGYIRTVPGMRIEQIFK